MLDCELYLCVYNKDEKCTLDEISINFAGMCEGCTIPNIPTEIIEKCKQDTFDRWAADWPDE